MFRVGDRVRLATPITLGGREPVGTVMGFQTPDFAAHVDAPDDVLVRWDTGLEIPVAPVGLMPARGNV
jgi:hypothetical protein